MRPLSPSRLCVNLLQSVVLCSLPASTGPPPPNPWESVFPSHFAEFKQRGGFGSSVCVCVFVFYPQLVVTSICMHALCVFMFKTDNKDRGGARVTIDDGDYHNMGFHTCWCLWTCSRVQGILISHWQCVLTPVWKAKGGGGDKKKKQNAICLLLDVTTL